MATTENGFGSDEVLLDHWNSTSNLEMVELECKLKMATRTIDPISPFPMCNYDFDNITCWPPASAGEYAILPCFSYFNGVKYDDSKNASRLCTDSGVWSNYTDYSDCHPLEPLMDPSRALQEYTIIVYFIGYSLSLVAGVLAVTVFLLFRDLACLRNSIHTNLMTAFVMAAFSWIIAAAVQEMHGQKNRGSCFLIIFVNYFHLTSYFWMFVEGLYLFILVVQTFSADKVTLRIYLFIGWGCPLILITLWACLKVVFPPASVEPSLGEIGVDSILMHCVWMHRTKLDWLYEGTALMVLALNMVFLGIIVTVLFTKLRSSNASEHEQYLKAAKALLVLIPLLGTTHIIVLKGPTIGMPGLVFSYLRTILLSTQGLIVALLYCFLNSEVRQSIRSHLSRWNEVRTVGRRKPYHVRFRAMGTENGRDRPRRKSSYPSEMTMTSYVCTNNSLAGNSLTVHSTLQPPRPDSSSSRRSSQTQIVLM